MNNFQRLNKTTINKGVEQFAGERLETLCQRMEEANEPISAERPLVYQERSEGVNPQYNIRADKWEHAQEAMDLLASKIREKRFSKMEELKKAGQADDTKIEKNN